MGPSIEYHVDPFEIAHVFNDWNLFVVTIVPVHTASFLAKVSTRIQRQSPFIDIIVCTINVL